MPSAMIAVWAFGCEPHAAGVITRQHVDPMPIGSPLQQCVDQILPASPRRHHWQQPPILQPVDQLASAVALANAAPMQHGSSQHDCQAASRMILATIYGMQLPSEHRLLVSGSISARQKFKSADAQHMLAALCTGLFVTPLLAAHIAVNKYTIAFAQFIAD